jgi:hypothetical protein
MSAFEAFDPKQEIWVAPFAEYKTRGLQVTAPV